MATHASALAWKIPWTEEPGGRAIESMGLKMYNLMTKKQQSGSCLCKEKDIS